MDKTATELAAEQQRLLAGLLDTADAPTLAPVAMPRIAASPQAAPRTERPRAQQPAPRPQPSAGGAFSVNGWYERLGTTLGLAGALATCAGLWWVGAFFTLEFLARLGLVLAGLGWWAWLIPASITGAELFLWPEHVGRWHTLFWFGVLCFDVGSTAAGLMQIAAGYTIPLFAGITLPRGGIALVAVGGAVGLVCAVVPEKYGRIVVRDLWALWRPVLLRRGR